MKEQEIDHARVNKLYASLLHNGPLTFLRTNPLRPLCKCARRTRTVKGIKSAFRKSFTNLSKDIPSVYGAARCATDFIHQGAVTGGRTPQDFVYDFDLGVSTLSRLVASYSKKNYSFILTCRLSFSCSPMSSKFCSYLQRNSPLQLLISTHQLSFLRRFTTATIIRTAASRTDIDPVTVAVALFSSNQCTSCALVLSR